MRNKVLQMAETENTQDDHLYLFQFRIYFCAFLVIFKSTRVVPVEEICSRAGDLRL